MTTVGVFAPAKINLFLHVLGRRPDGYHLLESLVAFADIGDDITASSASVFNLTLEGPFANALDAGEENSVIKAATFLQHTSQREGAANLTLTKNLPIASGVGGGSSDAAATLLAMQRLYDLTTLPSDRALAASLGADVPVCIRATPTLMRGIGDELESIAEFPSGHLVLVNPNHPLPTADVFRAFGSSYSAPLKKSDLAGWKSFAALIGFLKTTHNDLTAAATKILPELEAVLAALATSPGCELARMSGSGATCFGLFQAPDLAQQAADAIAATHRAWWTKHGQFMTTRPYSVSVS